jgi:hypothetical protein
LKSVLLFSRLEAVGAGVGELCGIYCPVVCQDYAGGVVGGYDLDGEHVGIHVHVVAVGKLGGLGAHAPVGAVVDGPYLELLDAVKVLCGVEREPLAAHLRRHQGLVLGVIHLVAQVRGGAGGAEPVVFKVLVQVDEVQAAVRVVLVEGVLTAWDVHLL